MNLSLSQKSLNGVYLYFHCDTFKNDNALVYKILLKMLTDTDIYVYVKQRNGMQNSWTVFFNVHKQFLDPDYVARYAAEAERKLQTSRYDGEREGWDLDKYVALNKEQHAIIESLTDYGYSGMNNGTKVHHFLQSIKSIELEVTVNIVWAQPENYSTNFDATVYQKAH